MNDFLGCSILREKDSDECWILPNHLVTKLVTTFSEMTRKLRKTNTPGTPREVQKITEKDKKELLPEKHKQFRSGIGSLMYLLKHSRPEMSNTIRELSRCISDPSDNNRKELWRVIKWAIDNPDIGL